MPIIRETVEAPPVEGFIGRLQRWGKSFIEFWFPERAVPLASRKGQAIMDGMLEETWATHQADRSIERFLGRNHEIVAQPPFYQRHAYERLAKDETLGVFITESGKGRSGKIPPYKRRFYGVVHDKKSGKYYAQVYDRLTKKHVIGPRVKDPVIAARIATRILWRLYQREKTFLRDYLSESN